MRKGRSAAVVVLVSLIAWGCSAKKPTADESLGRADQYFKDEKYAEAIVEYRKAVSIDPNLGEARFNLAQSYARTNDLGKAFPEYIRAADLLPERLDVQLAAGTFLLAAGRFEDARSRALSVLVRDPMNADAQVLKGSAAAGLKDLDGAVADIEEAIKMAPGDDRPYSQLGAMKMLKGRQEEAEAAFKSAVDVNPKSVNAQLALATFYWLTGRPDEAEGPLQEALLVEPNNLRVQRAISVFYLSSGRVKEAEAPMKAVLEIAKNNASRLALADYYITTNRRLEALPLLQTVAADKDGLAQATLRLASIDYALGKKAEAHQQVDAVLQKEPRQPQLLLLKGRLLFLERKLDEALLTAQAATAAAPESALAHFLAGQIYQAKRDSPNAIAAFTEVLKLNPRASAAQLQLAQLNMAAGSSATAVEFAEQAFKGSGESPASRQVLARTLASNGQVDRAMSETSDLLKKYPRVASLHADLGRYYLLKNDRVKSRLELERARELDAKSGDAISGLVALDLIEKNTAHARGLIDAALANAPKDTQLLFLSSVVHASSGMPKEQERTLRQILEIDPNNMQAYQALAMLFVRTGRLDEARKEYEAVWQKQPKAVSAPTMIGLIHEAQNNRAEAQKVYEKVLVAAPDSAVAANNLAWLYAEQGANLDLALQFAQAAVQKIPNSPQVNDTLGWVYLKKDLVPQAVTAFETSVRLDPKNPIYPYHLGMARQKAGSGDAKAAFEAALKLKPDFKEAQAALNTLPR